MPYQMAKMTLQERQAMIQRMDKPRRGRIRGCFAVIVAGAYLRGTFGGLEVWRGRDGGEERGRWS
jgi:hypothetical protein